MSELHRVTGEKGTCGHHSQCGTAGEGGEAGEFTVKSDKIARKGRQKRKGGWWGRKRKRETEFVRQRRAHAYPIPSCKWDSQLILFIFC